MLEVGWGGGGGGGGGGAVVDSFSLPCVHVWLWGFEAAQVKLVVLVCACGWVGGYKCDKGGFTCLVTWLQSITVPLLG